jgi:hypothetical protein
MNMGGADWLQFLRSCIDSQNTVVCERAIYLMTRRDGHRCEEIERPWMFPSGIRW